jgi:hypothetical protein
MENTLRMHETAVAEITAAVEERNALNKRIEALEEELEQLREGEDALESLVSDVYEVYTAHKDYIPELTKLFDAALGRVI